MLHVKMNYMPSFVLIWDFFSSSAPSMPYMYEIADSYSVDRRVSGFCIPIGVTLNADGSALFICTSVLFLAQMHGIVMDMAQMAVLG